MKMQIGRGKIMRVIFNQGDEDCCVKRTLLADKSGVQGQKWMRYCRCTVGTGIGDKFTHFLSFQVVESCLGHWDVLTTKRRQSFVVDELTWACAVTEEELRGAGGTGTTEVVLDLPERVTWDGVTPCHSMTPCDTTAMWRHFSVTQVSYCIQNHLWLTISQQRNYTSRIVTKIAFLFRGTENLVHSRNRQVFSLWQFCGWCSGSAWQCCEDC